MAFVSVPKDLTKVKNKIILNLTKRQLICLGIAAAVGLPFYFLARGLIGSSNASGFFICHVRERRTSFRESPEKYDYSKIYPSSVAKV